MRITKISTHRVDLPMKEGAYSWGGQSFAAFDSTVVMTLTDALAHVPIIHVFRFDEAGLIRRLEAFLDFDQVEMVSGERPDWMPTSS